jgi:hypothetical protein
MSLLRTIIKFESAESDPVLAAKLYKKPKDKDDDVYKGGGGSGYGSGSSLALRTALLAAATGGGS